MEKMNCDDPSLVVGPFKFHPDFFNNFPSKCTRTSYLNDLRKFFEFVMDKDPSVKKYADVTRVHVINYRNYLEDFGGMDGGPTAPKSIARKLAAISSYFNFLVEIGESKINPATSVKRPRREVKTPTNALNRDQVRAMLDSIDRKTLAGSMHFALLMTFFTTGMRKSEVLNIKLKDYREINDYQVIEFKGKGGKISQKLLHPMCVEAISAYMQMMQSNGRELHDEDWLFQPSKNPSDPTDLNKRLNPRTINEIIDHYALKIALGFKVTPHSCRATFISELLELGVDIYRVAREVNHSSVTTTQEYDKRRKKIQDSPVFNLKF